VPELLCSTRKSGRSGARENEGPKDTPDEDLSIAIAVLEVLAAKVVGIT
jgi:hypothetical protein